METNKIVILPSYNEKSSLIKICKQLKKKKIKFIILDDHSNDGSAEWLKKNNIYFIRNKKNLGYERNILNGFKHVLRKKNIKYIITFDADGQHKIGDLSKIIKLLKNKSVDILIGNRQEMNRWSENLISFLYNIIFKIKDPLTGLKVYNVNILKKYQNKISDSYFLVDLLTLSSKHGSKIINYPITTNKTEYSRIGFKLRIHFKILKCIKFIILNY